MDLSQVSQHPDGNVVVTSEDGSIAEMCRYRNGQLHGLYSMYQGDIKIKEYLYDQGYIRGMVSTWYPNGNHKKVFFISKEGVKYGPCVSWWRDIFAYDNKTSGLKREYIYLNGKKEGEEKNWNTLGELTIVRKFSRGELQSSTSFYPNGNRKESISYTDGQLDGEYILYFENGEEKMKAVYIGGVLSENVTISNQDGSTWFQTSSRRKEDSHN